MPKHLLFVAITFIASSCFADSCNVSLSGVFEIPGPKQLTVNQTKCSDIALDLADGKPLRIKIDNATPQAELNSKDDSSVLFLYHWSKSGKTLIATSVDKKIKIGYNLTDTKDFEMTVDEAKTQFHDKMKNSVTFKRPVAQAPTPK